MSFKPYRSDGSIEPSDNLRVLRGLQAMIAHHSPLMFPQPTFGLSRNRTINGDSRDPVVRLADVVDPNCVEHDVSTIYRAPVSLNSGVKKKKKRQTKLLNQPPIVFAETKAATVL